MFNFFRKKEPPPPPPPPKTPVWVTIAIPFIFATIVGLIGIVYTSLAEEIKTKANQTTVEQMLINQKQVIDMNQKTLEKQQQNIEKQQDTLDKTLQVIIQIQTEQKLMKETVLAPKSFVVEETQKKSLSPSELKEYLQLNAEERAIFRKLNPEYGELPN